MPRLALAAAIVLPAALAMPAALAILTGCAAGPPTSGSDAAAGETGRDDLRGIDLVDGVGQRASRLPSPDPGAKTRLDRQTLTFGIQEPVNLLWETVDTDFLPVLTRGVLAANGIRLGVLRAGDVANFRGLLPTRVRAREEKGVIGTGERPLFGTAEMEPGAFVDLTVPPYTRRTDRLRGGRMQLLLQATPAAGGTSLTLTPHHHRLRPSVVPRTAAEKALDGRIFRELSLRIELDPSELLVIGLHWPNAPRKDPPDPVDPLLTVTEADPAADLPEAAREFEGAVIDLRGVEKTAGVGLFETPPADPRAIPPHFGRGLFTRIVKGGGSQTLIVVRARPE